MYNENVPLNNDNNYTEIDGNDPSTIHHFYHKLFKLFDNMNTESAKKQAYERTKFMRQFVDEFIEE